MAFAHRCLDIRRIIYVYVLVNKYMNTYLQNGGGGEDNYPASYLTRVLLV